MLTERDRQLSVSLIDLELPSVSRYETLRQRFRFDEANTVWHGGTAPLKVTDADVVFIAAHYDDQVSASVHHDEHKRINQILERGSLVFVFLGNCSTFHLKNLLDFKGTVARHSGHPATACKICGSSQLDGIIARFSNRIVLAPAIEASGGSPFLINNLNQTIGSIERRGKGAIVYLPHFGQWTDQVIQAILLDVVPKPAPYLIYDEEAAWLSESQYLMPEAFALRQQLNEERVKYEHLAKELEQRFDEAFAADQAFWGKLLTATGEQLKLAVKRALETFCYTVVDVDQYWKDRATTSKPKEEDLWAREGVIPDPKDQDVVLVEVKSSEKGPTTEAHYAQLIKYMNRRRAEYRNPDLRGMLIINHAYLLPPAVRMAAFSTVLIEDAVRDGVTLVSTWDLYRLGKSVRGHELTANDACQKLKRAGLVEI